MNVFLEDAASPVDDYRVERLTHAEDGAQGWAAIGLIELIALAHHHPQAVGAVYHTRTPCCARMLIQLSG